MGKSAGRRLYEIKERLPGAVQRPIDGAVRVAARVTRRVRDREEGKRRFDKWLYGTKKKARGFARSRGV